MNYSQFKAGDQVRMKPLRKSSSLGYAAVAGKIMTIKEVLPKYAWACTFEETGSDVLFRLKDVAEVLA